jgi:hypothetical protein
MKRWMMIAAALFFVRQAQAADMSVIVEATADHPALILVKGQFMKGDDARFSALADAQKTRAIVFLESQGGLAWMGIQIGLAIRRHGFSTAVVDNVQCSSACAVAWMGGKERFMGARSRIGFHAARASMTDQAVASGANAAIGAYLYEIGVTDYKTIIFLTSAPPQEMRWLSLADAIRLKIDVTAFSFLQYQWAWARAALDLKPREPTEPLKQQVTDAAPPKVPAPLPAKRPSQTAPSPSPCEGTEAHVGNEMRCLKPGDSFRDCPDCPEMVVVPAGEFTMGSEQSNDEEPVHKVTIAKPFAAGKFEVTFDNWDACVIAGRCKHLPDDGSWGRGKRPVINVSWDDITKQYLPWLSRETRETYRLLTEAEWEYAARAGSRGKYTWGDEIGSDRANCDGCGSQ